MKFKCDRYPSQHVYIKETGGFVRFENGLYKTFDEAEIRALLSKAPDIEKIGDDEPVNPVAAQPQATLEAVTEDVPASENETLDPYGLSVLILDQAIEAAVVLENEDGSMRFNGKDLGASREEVLRLLDGDDDLVNEISEAIEE